MVAELSIQKLKICLTARNSELQRIKDLSDERFGANSELQRIDASSLKIDFSAYVYSALLPQH